MPPGCTDGQARWLCVALLLSAATAAGRRARQVYKARGLKGRTEGGKEEGRGRCAVGLDLIIKGPERATSACGWMCVKRNQSYSASVSSYSCKRYLVSSSLLFAAAGIRFKRATPWGGGGKQPSLPPPNTPCTHGGLLSSSCFYRCQGINVKTPRQSSSVRHIPCPYKTLMRVEVVCIMLVLSNR